MLLALNNLLLAEKCPLSGYKVTSCVKYIIRRYYYKKYNLKEYSRAYEVLEIPDDSDQECVRKAFIELCKKYHPDSKTASANASKFQEVECAYRTLQNKFAEERWNVDEGIGEYGLYYKEKKENKNNLKPEVFDIKHTAPQHRQYLSYDGVGSGTPSQREKQYIKYKTAVAVENVHDHHIKKMYRKENLEKGLIVKDKTEAKKIKTRFGMERLVEDLIQESMAKGHFDNLKGQGKPLPPSNYNPYVDFVTHKMNEILIDNGFIPEWITLQKEISDEIQVIKEKLAREREKLGCLPLSFMEQEIWDQTVDNLKTNVQTLNQKINKYNLLVPTLQKQKLYFNLEDESKEILKCGNYCPESDLKEMETQEVKKVKKVKEVKEVKEEEDVLSSLFSLFK